MDNIVRSKRLACFFDSGIGGIALLNECEKRSDNCRFAYFSDNYNVPYGNRSHEEILKLVSAAFEKIENLHPDVAVVACNTVTAECIKPLRQKYDFPIIGIQPAVKPAIEQCGSCAVLATPATAASEALKTLVSKYGGETNVKIIPCPELAAYIENNVFNYDIAKLNSLLPDVDCASIVLGCTHYSFIKDVINERYNKPVFDGLEGTAANFCKILGISDHYTSGGNEVMFYGGNVSKNYYIYNYLRNNGKLSGD